MKTSEMFFEYDLVREARQIAEGAWRKQDEGQKIIPVMYLPAFSRVLSAFERARNFIYHPATARLLDYGLTLLGAAVVIPDGAGVPIGVGVAGIAVIANNLGDQKPLGN